ncbi:MAG: arginase family protein [Chloroflexota bacterium]|nr:arginase family protein [Chloroflexota bacterium]
MAVTFLGFPSAEPESVQAEVAILGVPAGVTYPTSVTTLGCAEAPSAIRARSQRLTRFVDHHDFDLDGPMLPTPLGIVDCGDVVDVGKAQHSVEAILEQGAIPIVLGGDDSVPIPTLRAFAGRGPLTVVQVDAHLDYRDSVAGVRDGYSSPMRRASEMEHVAQIVQVGLRGVGSARTADVADARAAGNIVITARELRERGVPWLLERIATDAFVFISFDCDGLDPAVCPAVSAAAPGGLSYDEAADLLSGIARDRRLAGAAFTELVPTLDLNELSALVVTRLIMRLLAGLARRA